MARVLAPGVAFCTAHARGDSLVGPKRARVQCAAVTLPREFVPPRRLLLGPGPSQVHPRVLAAMALPLLGHLDPAFVAMMDEVKALLRIVFGTTRSHHPDLRDRERRYGGV